MSGEVPNKKENNIFVELYELNIVKKFYISTNLYFTFRRKIIFSRNILLHF